MSTTANGLSVWAMGCEGQNINPYIAGIDFSRQNLTFKVDPRTLTINNYVKLNDLDLLCFHRTG